MIVAAHKRSITRQLIFSNTSRLCVASWKHDKRQSTLIVAFVHSNWLLAAHSSSATYIKRPQVQKRTLPDFSSK